VVIVPKALDGDIPGAPSPEQETILRAIATAWEWAALLESGKVATVTELARTLKFSFQYTVKTSKFQRKLRQCQSMLKSCFAAFCLMRVRNCYAPSKSAFC